MANQFKKEQFSSLLRKAMGSDRSINQYSLHSTVSATYISKLLRGIVDIAPGPEVIRKLTDKAYNNVTYEQLMVAAGHWSEAAYKGPLYAEDDLKGTGLIQIPVLGSIKAGYDLLASQQIIGYELLPQDFVKEGEYFFLRVTGDSMIEDGIREGFRVLVKRQDFVDQGKIAVVLINSDEATLKRVYYQDGVVILQASNRNIPPMVLPLDKVRIQGQVTKVEFDV